MSILTKATVLVLNRHWQAVSEQEEIGYQIGEQAC